MENKEWQLIETAPKDGTTILIYIPHFDDEDKVDICTAYCCKCCGWHPVIADGACMLVVAPDPTHWMPLPELPKETNGK